MYYLSTLLKFGFGWIVGLIFTIPVTSIGCCLFTAFPMLRFLEKNGGSIYIQKAKTYYAKAVACNAVLVLGPLFLVYFLVSKTTFSGIIFSILLSICIGSGKWGTTDENLIEFCQTMRKFYVPGKEEAANTLVQAMVSFELMKTPTNPIGSFLRGMGAAILMWLICRAVPALICNYAVSMPYFYLYTLSTIIFLPLGWYIAGRTVKWTSPGWMNATLYIYAVIEGLSVFNLCTKLFSLGTKLSSLGSDGVYGMTNLFSVVFLVEIAYVVICILLVMETKRRKT